MIYIHFPGWGGSNTVIKLDGMRPVGVLTAFLCMTRLKRGEYLVTGDWASTLAQALGLETTRGASRKLEVDRLVDCS